MKINKWIGAAFIHLLAITANAQYIAETKFADYLQTMPSPQPTIKETIQQLGSNPDQAVMDAFKLPKSQRDFILQSFLAKFKDNIAETKKNKALLIRYSTEEQKMMRNFQTATAGLDEEARLSSFYLLMEERPLVSTGKLSWSKLTTPLSAAGQTYYQQLLTIEKALNRAVFSKEVGERDMMRNMFAIDPEIQIFNAKLEEEKVKVPMKKVKVFEDQDATAEIQDPVKMMKVLKDDNERRQLHFQKKHRDFYIWWKKNEATIRQCAISMDALLEATAFGNNLHANDKQLISMIGDVQERIWEALMNLNSITRTIVANAQTAEAGNKFTEDAVEMYKKTGLTN